MQSMNKRKLLSVGEAAEYLSIAEWTIRSWVSQRRIPVVKLGRRTLFDVNDLDQWIEQHKIPAVYCENDSLDSVIAR